ncbi:MAG: hypothetical protein KGQ83_06475, partial [Planctomycetes bacterium]|nr:hypothetical protein [Planctomycetota bacterium]
CHLKVLHRNKLDKICDCRLRPDFYYRHLKQVISDSPWTWITLKDVAECVPYLLICMFQFPLLSIKKLILAIIRLSKSTIRKIFKKDKMLLFESPEIQNSAEQSEVLKFRDINHFADWVNENHVKRRYVKQIGV